MDPKQPNETAEQQGDRQVSSPYGPQHAGEDKTAGGADSSPFETESTGAPRKRSAEGDRAKNLPQPNEGP
jgi:hypothetical protein